jgi:hypothetical protein
LYDPEKERQMKVLVLIFVLMTATTLDINLYGAGKVYQFQLPEKDEPIYGTWVNPEYSGENYLYAQKWVYLNWGYGKELAKVDDTDPLYEWTFILVEKRIDRIGNIWYKVLNQWASGRDYDLIRISKDLETLECVTGAGFPEEGSLVQTDSSYRIFKKKK